MSKYPVGTRILRDAALPGGWEKKNDGWYYHSVNGEFWRTMMIETDSDASVDKFLRSRPHLTVVYPQTAKPEDYAYIYPAGTVIYHYSHEDGVTEVSRWVKATDHWQYVSKDSTWPSTDRRLREGRVGDFLAEVANTHLELPFEPISSVAYRHPKLLPVPQAQMRRMAELFQDLNVGYTQTSRNGAWPSIEVTNSYGEGVRFDFDDDGKFVGFEALT